MKDTILIGRQDQILTVPASEWLEHLERAQHHPSGRLDFMTPEHHRVRNFAVTELPRHNGMPLSPAYIASRLPLSTQSVRTLLDDLQKHLFFLVLNEHGDVSWAFPVTSEQTPHRLRFSTGEHTYAA